MKKSDRPVYEYRRYKSTRPELEQYQVRPKPTEGELRSLECSSVQEVQNTNQSYENSWLEKLVSNIDEDVPNNGDKSRNFAKKNNHTVHQNYMVQRPNEVPLRQRAAYSCSKKSTDYTPFSKISEAITLQNEEYPVSRFRNQQYQRISRKNSMSIQNHRYQINYAVADNKEKAGVDLNESNQSYGRIKKLNHQKPKVTSSKYETTTLESNLQKIDINLTKASPAFDHQVYEPLAKPIGSYLKQSRNKDYTYSKYDDIKALKRKASEYFAEREGSPKYERLDYRSRNFQSVTKNYQTAKQNVGVVSKQKTGQRQYEKEDEFKMEEMAKKLNMVLQNINKKSKLLSNHPTQQKKIENYRPIIREKAEPEPTYHYQSKNHPHERHQLKPQIQSKPMSRQKYSSGISDGLAKAHVMMPKVERPRSKEKQSEDQHNKYQMMKKSLGMSKHIPHEIILEQSSSEINSEISPRTEFLNRQFRTIFEKLDSNKTGQLTKNNCALDLINDDIKYLFGAIFSKIKYKNERMSLKTFIQDCQNIVKEFHFSELKEVLGKYKGVSTFKLHEKDTESERWNNDTNNDLESKRSSDRSEVVKRYEFQQENNLLERNQALNRQKVHWAPQQAKEFKVLSQHNTGHMKALSFGERQTCLEAKDTNKAIPSYSIDIKQVNRQPIHQETRLETSPLGQKQNNKTGQSQKQKKDFEKMCENLNNKLNNYLTTITKKSGSSHQIPLEFSQLSKHWNKS